MKSVTHLDCNPGFWSTAKLLCGFKHKNVVCTTDDHEKVTCKKCKRILKRFLKKIKPMKLKLFFYSVNE